MCDAEITLHDLDTGENFHGSRTSQLDVNNVFFSAAQLTTNRHYNVSVRASNVIGTAVSYFNISKCDKPQCPYLLILLGMHGIDHVMVTAIGGGTVRAAVTYTPDCNAALGTLFSLSFITDSGTVDFTRSILLPVDRNSSLSSTLPIHLSPGQYQVHVYDIEQDGILNNGPSYPAAVQELELLYNGISQGKTLN